MWPRQQFCDLLKSSPIHSKMGGHGSPQFPDGELSGNFGIRNVIIEEYVRYVGTAPQSSPLKNDKIGEHRGTWGSRTSKVAAETTVGPENRRLGRCVLTVWLGEIGRPGRGNAKMGMVT